MYFVYVFFYLFLSSLNVVSLLFARCLVTTKEQTRDDVERGE